MLTYSAKFKNFIALSTVIDYDSQSQCENMMTKKFNSADTITEMVMSKGVNVDALF